MTKNQEAIRRVMWNCYIDLSNYLSNKFGHLEVHLANIPSKEEDEYEYRNVIRRVMLPGFLKLCDFIRKTVCMVCWRTCSMFVKDIT